ncbi:MAG: hypothetical protein Q9176_004378 [Flavoplaca citrina]
MYYKGDGDAKPKLVNEKLVMTGQNRVAIERPSSPGANDNEHKLNNVQRKAPRDFIRILDQIRNSDRAPDEYLVQQAILDAFQELNGSRLDLAYGNLIGTVARLGA